MFAIAVFVDERLCSGKATAVDDAGVVECVGKYDTGFVNDAGNHAEVGLEAAGEYEAAFHFQPVGEFLFECFVDGEVSGHEARGCCAASESH